jgi:hypothetical protein
MSTSFSVYDDSGSSSRLLASEVFYCSPEKKPRLREDALIKTWKLEPYRC